MELDKHRVRTHISVTHWKVKVPCETVGCMAFVAMKMRGKSGFCELCSTSEEGSV